MVAPLAIAGLSAAGSLFSGITGGKGAKKAANIAAQQAEKDRALAQQVYNQNYSLAAPTVDRGNAAGAQINALLGLGGNTGAAQDALAQYKASTGYQTRLNEGYNAINSGYAARGALESGAAQKALLKYGQAQASGEFNNYLGQLSNQQGAGLNALGSVTGSGIAYVNQATAAGNSAASAGANAALYGSQVQANALGGIANALGNVLGNSSYKTPKPDVLSSGTFSPGGSIYDNYGFIKSFPSAGVYSTPGYAPTLINRSPFG